MTYIRTKFAAPLDAEPVTIDGEAAYRVPLTGRDGVGKYALLDPEGLDTLRWAGARALYVVGDGAGNKYVAYLRTPTHQAAMASRTIISAPEGRRVVYVNGDRTDLRTANLVIQPRKDEDPFALACQKAAAISEARRRRREVQ